MTHAGRVIRDVRERAAVSQADLAARLGTSQAAVWRWERGLVEPSFAAVFHAVSACGFAPSVLIQDVDADEWRLVEAGRDRTPAQRLRDLESYSRFVTKGRQAVKRARRG